MHSLIEPEFLATVNAFLLQYAGYFLPTEGGDFHHEAHDVFREYKALYERQMETHLAALGLTLEEFLAQADQVLGTECIEILVSLEDFEHFAVLMERVAKGKSAVLPINDADVEEVLEEIEYLEAERDAEMPLV